MNVAMSCGVGVSWLLGHFSSAERNRTIDEEVWIDEKTSHPDASESYHRAMESSSLVCHMIGKQTNTNHAKTPQERRFELGPNLGTQKPAKLDYPAN